MTTTDLNLDRNLFPADVQKGKALQNLEDQMVGRSADLILDQTSPPVAGSGFVAGSGNEGLVAQLTSAAMAVKVATGGYAYNHLGKRVVIPTTTSLAVVASDATNARKDIVVLTAAGKLAIRTGTPAGSPADPMLTAGDVPLARITVDALATTIVTAKITDLRNRKGLSGAKVAAGSLSTAKLAVTGVKAASFSGRNGAGAITLTGAAVGDRVLAIFQLDAAGAIATAAGFETAITTINQIQQSSASDLSTHLYAVLLIPAAA